METSWVTMNNSNISATYPYKRFLLILFILVTITGCSRPPYEVAYVTGKVKIDGQPMTEGSITFSPVAKGEKKKVGKPAYADLMPDGSFILSTYSLHDGAVVGTHRASINSGADESYVYDEKGNRIPVIQDATFGTLSIYSKEFEVKSDEENDFTIEITSEYIKKHGRWND